MKKTIKYLQDGKYHYATVKDVGDIELLKTKNKADLVSAINELITDGVKESNGDREAISKEIKDSIEQSSKEIAKTVEELSKESALAFQEKIKVVVDLTNAEIKRSTDSLEKEVEKVRKEGADLVNKTKEDFNTTVLESNKKIQDLNKKSTQLDTELSITKKGLQKTSEELSNAKLNVVNVEKKIDEVKGELSSMVTSAQLNALKEQLEKTNTEVRQTNKELAGKVSKESLDLLKGDLQKTNAQLKIQSELIEGKVSKDTLVNDLTDFQVKKANLLSGTREFMNWNKSNQAFVHNSKTTFNHCTSIEIDKAGESVSLLVDGLKIGQTYTLSVDGILKSEAETVHILAKDIGIMATAEKRSKVTTQHEIYFITFVAKAKETKIEFVADGTLTNGNILSITMPKLEVGAIATPWEQNFNDSYARIEHVEAAQKISADQIDQVVKKQTEIGKKQVQTETTISHLSDGIKVQTDKLEKIGKDVTEQKGKLDLTAQKLRTEFEESTNKKIGSIQDTGNNLIENSAFVADFESWQTVSKKAKLEKIADDRWLNLSQSGLTAEMPIAAETNYFPIQKNDHLVVAFDFIVKSVQFYDVKTVFQIEYFDIKGNRVDFKDITLKDLNAESISSNSAKRLVWKTVVSREDIKKAAIKPILKKNGDVLYTRFFAKVSSIDDGNYQPNPQDLLMAQAKQKFELEQTAEGLKGKATTKEVNVLDKKIKDNELLIEANSKQVGIKLTEISNDASHTKESVQQNLKKIGSVEQKVNQVTTVVSDVKKDVDNLPAYIQSRGQNLLTNGYGTLKSNKNFPSLVFDPVHRIVGAGSFRGDKQVGSWETAELIDIDTKKTYGFKYHAKTKLGKSRSYAYLVPFDVDGLQITPQMMARNGYFSPSIKPKIVTLTKELKQGDMEIHLSSVADFKDEEVNSTEGHRNSILFWGYKNSLGYEYPVGTYSRTFGYMLWTKGQVDRKNNVIKLLAPFKLKNPATSNGSFPAGHQVSPTCSGGTFIYPEGAMNTIIPNDWKVYDLTIHGEKDLPLGIAKVRLGGLYNRDLKGENDITWYNGLEFFDKTLTEEIKTEAEVKVNEIRTSIEKAKTESNKKFAEMTANTEKIRQSIGEVSSKTETTVGQLKTKFETDINTAKKIAADSLKNVEGSVSKKIDDTKTAVEKDIQSVKGDVAKSKSETTTAIGEINKKIQSQQTENQKKWAENTTTQDQIKQSVNHIKTTTTKSIEETTTKLSSEIAKNKADTGASINKINSDLKNQIATVDKKVSTVKDETAKKIADIVIKNNEINQHVEDLKITTSKTFEENKTQIETSLKNGLSKTEKNLQDKINLTNSKVAETEKSLKSEIKSVDGKVNAAKVNLDKAKSELQGSINGAKSETEKLKKELVELAIGSRNILRNTSNFKDTKHWAISNGKDTNGKISIVTDIKYGNIIQYTLATIKPSWSFLGNYILNSKGTAYQFGKGQKYTVSFKYKLTANNGVTVSIRSGDATHEVMTEVKIDPAADWRLFKATFIAKESGVNPQLYFKQLDVSKNNGLLHIVEIQLEEGNIATGYAPNPDDFDEELVKINQTITTEKNETVKKFADINTKNNQIVQQVGDLKSSTTKTIADTKAVIEKNLTAAKNDLQGKITKVDGRVTTVQKDFDTKVAAVKTESGKISQKVTSLEGSVSKTQKELSGLSFGVENYLRDSDFTDEAFEADSTWRKTGNPLPETTFLENEDGHFAQITYAKADQDFVGVYQLIPIKLKKGDIVTFSFEGYHDSKILGDLNVGIHWRKGGQIAAQTWNVFKLTATNDRYAHQYVAASDTDQVNLMIYGVQKKAFSVFLTRTQLERGNRLTDWKKSFSEMVDINTRLRQVEQDITEGSITQSIADVRDYAEGLQKALDDKADSSELSDYITEGSLEEKINDAKDYTNQLIEGLNLSRYVEASEFKQLRDSFNFNLQNSGGINMIRNSLGYADFSYWDTPVSMVTTTDGSLKNAGFGSGFKSIGKGTRMKQTIMGTSVTGKYVLSFYLYNPNGASAGIDLFSDNKKLSYVTKAGKSEEFQFISYPFESATGNIRIEVCANGEDVVWTGLMLNAGEVPLTWQSHQEEVYNENIRFDNRGITVKNEISGGYTNISPKEFAGYADIDGEVKRVFSVNGDITEVHKLYAEEELTMNPIKIVSITEGTNTGWAFVGM